MNMNWKNIYRGFFMGVSDIVPGVSGGTIAVLLGIYDRLIASINGLFSKEWKRHLGFLIQLEIGVGLALFSLSLLMELLLNIYLVHTFYTCIIFILVLLTEGQGEGKAIVERTIDVYITLFFAGFLASAAMILPGISGSFILLIMGVYLTVINGLKELDIPVILTVGFGILIGLLTMSKVINYFLTHYRTATFALIIGLVIGSVFVIYPGMPTGLIMWIISIVTFVTGLLIAYLLGRIEY